MSDYAFLPEKYRKSAKIVDQGIDRRLGTNLSVTDIDRRMSFLQAHRELAARKQKYFSNVVMKILLPYGVIVMAAFYGSAWLGWLGFLSPLQKALLHLVLGLPVIIGAGIPMIFWKPKVPALHALETECLLLSYYKVARQK